MTIYIGIDCGMHGALCAITEDNHIDVKLFDTDLESDYMLVCNWIDYIQKLDNDVFIVIEQAGHISNGSMARQSLSHQQGIYEGILISKDIRYYLAKPQEWQKSILGSGKKQVAKPLSIKNVEELYPFLDFRLRTEKGKIACTRDKTEKKNDNIADAINIALYAMKIDR